MKNPVRLIVIFSLITVLSLALAPAWGQTGAGVVSGTVRDPSGQIVPGANVTITDTETNISRTAKTSDVGIYYFGAIPRGPYTMVVKKEGFKTWTSTLVLEVGQTVNVDVSLEVGNVQTVLEVTGAAPLISTAGAEVSDVRGFQQIRQLPLNGRSITQLFGLTAGVEGGGNARVNGLKVGSMGISYDGITEVDRFGGGIVREQPDLDDIQEFRIETTGSDAQFATPATVILKSRSGTNQFHASAFENWRSNAAGLRTRRREEPPGTPGPKLIRNEFGANAGGPILIPHLYHGRDKSFWFFNYEGHREVGRASNTPETSLGNAVPTDAMWNGDLSNLVDANGNKITIYDPTTTDPVTGLRQPFKGNIIPPGRISQIAKTLAALTERPTNNNNPFLAPNDIRLYSTAQPENKFTARVDQRISDKDNLSVRWTRDTSASTQAGGVFGNPVNVSAGFGTSRQNSSVSNIAVNYTRNISTTLLNELVVGVLRTPTSSGTLADFTNWGDKLGLPNPFSVTGWPTICAGDDFCWDSDNRKDEELTTEMVNDNFTWVKGRHSVQFGGELRREQNNIRELQQAQGSDDFGGPWTSQFDPVCDCAVPFTGDGFADMLLGLPDFLSNQYNRGFFYFRQTYAGLYAQDKWKAGSRLTITFGLRWDKWTPYGEKYNRLVTADIATITNPALFQVITPGNHTMESLPGIPPSVLASWKARGLSWVTADSLGYPSALFAGVNHDFGPRVGAAYQINSKTVIRGAYGIFYWPMPLSQILQTSRTNPPLNLRFSNQFLGPNAAGTGTQFDYTLSSAPSPDNFVGRATVDTQGIVTISPRAQSIFPYDGRNWTDSRAHSWNLTLERQLPRQFLLRLTYVGTHGTNLEQRVALNEQEPVFNFANRTGLAPPSNRDLLRKNRNWNPGNGYSTHIGFSNSNSFQIEIDKRYSNGLAMQWFYTYDRALTTTDVGGFTSGNLSINSESNGGMVPENFMFSGEPTLTASRLLRSVYSNSTNIPPQRIVYNFIYDLPFGRERRFGRNVSAALDKAIGGWQIAGIGGWNGGSWQSVAMNGSRGRFQAGNPTLQPDQRLTMTIFGAPQRLWFRGDFDPTSATNVQGGSLSNLVSPTIAQRVVRPFGPDCSGKFSGNRAVTLANGKCLNASGTQLFNPGSRGHILGPGSWNADLSVYKNFRIRERTNFRFSADFFNAFNHPRNVTPDSVRGLQNLAFQSNEPRLIQFTLRLDY